jgi:hypothetical protein
MAAKNPDDVVGGLLAIANALNRVASAIEQISQAMPTEEDIRDEIFQGVKDSFPDQHEITEAIHDATSKAMSEREE